MIFTYPFTKKNTTPFFLFQIIMPSASTPVLSLGVKHTPPPDSTSQPGYDHEDTVNHSSSLSESSMTPDSTASTYDDPLISPDSSKPKRNFDLSQISKAVDATDQETFAKSSFALKRTRSMGLLDQFIVKPSEEMTGSKEDYPHLSISDGSHRVSSPSNSSNNTTYYSQNHQSQLLQHQQYHPDDGSQNAQRTISSSSETSQESASLQTGVSESSSSTNSSFSTGSISNQNTTINNNTTAPQTANVTTTNTQNNNNNNNNNNFRNKRSSSTSPSPATHSGTPDFSSVHDDSQLAYEPSRHVDYLSHDWKESDISNCWRNIVSRRRDVANSARLENASWRTWTKAKYSLRTVSPESVNWLKDCDITWLYGPLYNGPINVHYTDPRNEEPSPHSDGSQPSNNNANGHKPILKKRTVSDKLFARQNSGHHTPTLSTIHSHSKDEPVVNVSATAAVVAHLHPDEHDDEEVDGTASTFLRHHNYRHRPHTGHSDERISRALNLPYRHMPGHLIKRAYEEQQQQMIKDHLINSSTSNSQLSNQDSTVDAGSDASRRTKTGIISFSLGTNNNEPQNIIHALSPSSYSSGVISSAPTSAITGPTTTFTNPVITSPVTLSRSSNSSVTSFRPIERHIHFNDRVEQCIAVDVYESSTDSDSLSEADSDDEEDDDKTKKDEDDNSYRRRSAFRHRRDWNHSSDSDSEQTIGGNNYRHNRHKSNRKKSLLSNDSSYSSSSSSSSSSSDEDEPGLFLSLRSSSTTSLHRIDKLGLTSASTKSRPRPIIAPLPATTLRATYDDDEDEQVKALEASSVAYAMSHNTQPRSHMYRSYDYNSVYQSPSQSPYHSPSQSIASSNNASTNVIDPSQIMRPSNILQGSSSSNSSSGHSKNSNDDDDDDDDMIVSLPSHLSAQIPIATASNFDFDEDSGSESDDEGMVMFGGSSNRRASSSQTETSFNFPSSSSGGGLMRSSSGGGGLMRSSSSSSNLASMQSSSSSSKGFVNLVSSQLKRD